MHWYLVSALLLVIIVAVVNMVYTHKLEKGEQSPHWKEGVYWTNVIALTLALVGTLAVAYKTYGGKVAREMKKFPMMGGLKPSALSYSPFDY